MAHNSLPGGGAAAAASVTETAGSTAGPEALMAMAVAQGAAARVVTRVADARAEDAAVGEWEAEKVGTVMEAAALAEAREAGEVEAKKAVWVKVVVARVE